jgi:two-component system response regulator YesN
MTYTVIVAEDEELLLTNLVQKIQKADPDFQELHKQAIRLWLW